MIISQQVSVKVIRLTLHRIDNLNDRLSNTDSKLNNLIENTNSNVNILKKYITENNKDMHKTQYILTLGIKISICLGNIQHMLGKINTIISLGQLNRLSHLSIDKHKLEKALSSNKNHLFNQSNLELVYNTPITRVKKMQQHKK